MSHPCRRKRLCEKALHETQAETFSQRELSEVTAFFCSAATARRHRSTAGRLPILKVCTSHLKSLAGSFVVPPDLQATQPADRGNAGCARPRRQPERSEREAHVGMLGSEMRLCKQKLSREGGVTRPRSIPLLIAQRAFRHVPRFAGARLFLERNVAWHDPKKPQPSGAAAK